MRSTGIPSEVELLLNAIDQAFDARSWHGTNLRGALRGLDAADAAWRPGGERHSIQELVLHLAYWKYAIRRRLTGERRGSFPMKGSNWFDVGEPGDQEAWRRDLALLAEEHRALREVVAGLPVRRLSEPVPGKRWLVRDLITGAAAHDFYHTGQIQLLKRLRQDD